MPSNLKNPAWLADQAVALAAEAGLEVTVWDEKRLADEGFGGILGVGQASATPAAADPARLHARRKASRRTPTVVLVGKGITFDTGGLSIKPGEAHGQHEARHDRRRRRHVGDGRAGRRRLPGARSSASIPAAENAVGGNALRPGDVVRHYGGRTTEVTNTDAEGRLVLADAMA